MINDLLEEFPPTFVVGCSHSGTTLMNAIIGSHSNIHSIRGETSLFVSDSIRKSNHLHSYYVDAWLNAKPRWTEKTALHILYMMRIFKYCSKAKIIVMLRDGRDVAASLYARTGNLGAAVDQWIEHNAVAQYFMNHPDVLFVKYEDLITDFEGVMMQVFEFIGEEYEEYVRYFYKNYEHADVLAIHGDAEMVHRELRRWQIAQPLFDGRGRYKELTKWQYRYVCMKQREMSRVLGYEDCSEEEIRWLQP